MTKKLIAGLLVDDPEAVATALTTEVVLIKNGPVYGVELGVAGTLIA